MKSVFNNELIINCYMIKKITRSQLFIFETKKKYNKLEEKFTKT